jgi:hypothetical protein
MNHWKSASLIAGVFLCFGAGTIVRGIFGLGDVSPDFGGSAFVAFLGLVGLEVSRRKLEEDSGEERPWGLHASTPLAVGIPTAIAVIWVTTVQGLGA